MIVPLMWQLWMERSLWLEYIICWLLVLRTRWSQAPNTAQRRGTPTQGRTGLQRGCWGAVGRSCSNGAMGSVRCIRCNCIQTAICEGPRFYCYTIFQRFVQWHFTLHYSMQMEKKTGPFSVKLKFDLITEKKGTMQWAECQKRCIWIITILRLKNIKLDPLWNLTL